MKECYIYIDRFVLSNDRYTSIYFDFISEKDYEIFTKELNLRRIENNSYIELKEYDNIQKLFPDSTYLLNLDLLKEAEFNDISEESAIFAYSGIINGITKRIFTSNPSHKISYINNYINDKITYNFNINKITVNNVGQGNWNELSNGESTEIVYDIGTNITAKSSDINKLWNKHSKKYVSSKTTLIISHWDIDHFLTLKALSINDIREHFSNYICCNKTKSITSQKALEKLQEALPNKGICICNPVRIGKHVLTQKKTELGNIHLYIGENSRSINLSGIILFIEGKNYNGFLTGDCSYAQLSDIINKERKTKPLVIVIPHHGGNGKNIRFKFQNKQPIINKALISVGKNTYHHPNKKVIDYLKQINASISQTNIIQKDISENL